MNVHRRILAPLLLPACLAEPPNVDLQGPRIVESSLVGPRSVEVEVWPTLALEFSEPIDPATVHAGSVVLVAWELLDEPCDLTPLCSEGSCERGRCQIQSLGSGDRSAIDRGEFDWSGPEAILLEFELDGPQLRVRPMAPLDAHRRYTFVIGPAVRDLHGAPLVDEYERAVAWQRDFVTADAGSSGPEPMLLTPASGQLDVATNLARVETRVWPPVSLPQPHATLLLEAQDGSEPISLIEPVDCVGWVPGTCLAWRLMSESELQPGVRYRPAGGTLVDRFGRASVRPGATRETWFASGFGPDLDPPAAELLAQLRGRCVAIWVDAGEPIEAVLQIGEQVRRTAIDRAGYIGLELGDVSFGDSIAWTLQLRDLADNHARHEGMILASPSVDAPRVRITEVLANPSGPEPDGEFVEVLAGPEGAQLDGVLLADLSFAQISEALALGEDPPGDPLPPVSLAAGELAIIVGNNWPSDSTSGVHVLMLDSSLANGGLKNAGEPMTLWMPSEHGPIELASYGNWIETGATSHDGRSVVAGLDACDLPDRWRSHPQGQSSPGALP